ARRRIEGTGRALPAAEVTEDDLLQIDLPHIPARVEDGPLDPYERGGLAVRVRPVDDGADSRDGAGPPRSGDHAMGADQVRDVTGDRHLAVSKDHQVVA